MKIYNAKTASVQLPLGMRRLVISGRSLSQEFMPTSQFLQMIARTFSPDEIALIVSGAWEGNMCAETPTLSEYVVSSVEQAIARFNPPEEIPEKKEEKKEEVKVEESVTTDTLEPSTPEKPEEEVKEEESTPAEEPKKAKRMRTAKRVTTRKKKTAEEKPAVE